MKNKMDFYTIKLQEDKTIYLRATENGFKWGKLEHAIYWQTCRDAEEFGERYFQNYNSWIVEKVIENV